MNKLSRVELKRPLVVDYKKKKKKNHCFELKKSKGATVNHTKKRYP